MFKRMTVGVLLVTATLSTIPAHATPPDSESPTTQQPARIEAPLALTPDPALLPATPVQELDPADHLSERYALSVFSDTGKILNSPLHFVSGDWLKVGLVAGTASSMFLIDGKVKDFSQSHKSAGLDRFASVGNALGTPTYTLPPLGAFYLYGVVNDDGKARKTALLALESFAITSIVTSGLKAVAHRHRPNSGDDPDTLDGPAIGLKNLSFCSGHTSSAFSMATIISEQYKESPIIPPLAYSLATLTGLSRIYSNAHWASDALVGAAVGYFISKGVLSYHTEKPRLTLIPSLGKEMTGMNLQYSF